MNTQTQSHPPPPPPKSPRSERWGPEIYVHLEFRVSWGKKHQPPKNHQVTYRSRGARERSPAFPRQVPAPNTNYLAAIHTFHQRQSRLREMRQHYASANNNPNRHHQMQEYYQAQQPPQQRPLPQVPMIQEPERPTRADARPSSHERGRSAPPPFGDNPWDVSVPAFQPRHSDMATPNQSMTEIKRKPLPAPPSQFRLGEGRHPWSTWSLPDGYDPDSHPKDDDDDEAIPARPLAGAGAASATQPGDRNSTTYATNPTMVSTFSPEPLPATNTSPPRTRDLETGRAKELGALSAAMMTVDNGFESQWWYQGRRETVASTTAAADEEQLPPRTPDESPVHRFRWSSTAAAAAAGGGGDVLSSPGGTITSMLPETPVVLPAGVVSPMTEAAFSPALVPASVSTGLVLQRSMSTRSEELWFREGGR